MILTTIAFYLFATILIASALMVIASKNPVHSVLFLILAFFNGAGLFVLLGAEFLAMILVVVYVGAVAVLFLFVVMMLDVDFAELKKGTLQYLPLGSLYRIHSGAGVGLGWVDLGVRACCKERCGQRHARQCIQHRGAGRDHLHAICLLLRDRGACAAGRDDRRHRADLAPAPGRAPSVDQPPERARSGSWPCAWSISNRGQGAWMATSASGNYLVLAAILFTIGVLGIFLNRKNVIVILMSIELILLSVNINFVAFSSFLGDLVGQVFALFVLTVAAAEAAIGLAILVVYYRNRGSIAVEDVDLMKG